MNRCLIIQQTFIRNPVVDKQKNWEPNWELFMYNPPYVQSGWCCIQYNSIELHFLRATQVR